MKKLGLLLLLIAATGCGAQGGADSAPSAGDAVAEQFQKCADAYNSEEIFASLHQTLTGSQSAGGQAVTNEAELELAGQTCQISVSKSLSGYDGSIPTEPETVGIGVFDEDGRFVPQLMRSDSKSPTASQALEVAGDGSVTIP